MKLSAQAARAFLRKPDASAAGVLIFGDDAMRVALARQAMIETVIGPEGGAEMRLTRIAAADLRRDTAALDAAVKAQGFFPGPRVALVEDATDGLVKTVAATLEDWRPGDAMIVLTAGALTARSPLRKLFEAGRATYAAGLYATPPSRDEIRETLTGAGLGDIPQPALTALESLAHALPPGDFRQTVDKIGLYKLDDPSPLTEADIAACAPATIEAGLDDMIDVLAEGRVGDIARIVHRLWSQGTQPVTLIIFVTRHFRMLATLAAAPGGASRAAERLRPPVYGPRRDKVVRQAGLWDGPRLDDALTILMDTDLALRSAGQRAPTHALVERAAVRIAHLARRGR